MCLSPCLVFGFSKDFQQYGFAQVGKKVMPSIVSVAVISTVNDMAALKDRILYMLQSPRKDLFGKDIINAPKKVGSSGSGFIIDPRGYIVTNYHVVEDAIHIKVLMNDSTILSADLVGYDSGTDLAVLKVQTKKNLPFLKWADSSKIKIGEWACAFGDAYGLGPTLTGGIISSSVRDLDNPKLSKIEGAQLIQGFIQTDAAINHGNSGGPLVDISGNVIGVNFAMVSASGGSDGIGLAIPSNNAKKIVNNIINYGHIKRAWLGVAIQAVTPEIAENLQLKKAQGAVVVSPATPGPAEAAGLRAADVILSLDGKPVKDASDVTRIIGELSVGKMITIEAWRDGKVFKTKAKLEEFQSHEDYKKTMKTSKMDLKDHVAVEEFELGVTSLTSQFRQRFGAENPQIQGVLVSDVKDGGWAMKHGIMVGDIIMEINHNPVPNPDLFKKELHLALQKGKPVLILVYKMGMKFFVGLAKKDKEETEENLSTTSLSQGSA